MTKNDFIANVTASITATHELNATQSVQAKNALQMINTKIPDTLSDEDDVTAVLKAYKGALNAILKDIKVPGFNAKASCELALNAMLCSVPIEMVPSDSPVDYKKVGAINFKGMTPAESSAIVKARNAGRPKP